MKALKAVLQFAADLFLLISVLGLLWAGAAMVQAIL